MSPCNCLWESTVSLFRVGTSASAGSFYNGASSVITARKEWEPSTLERNITISILYQMQNGNISKRLTQCEMGGFCRTIDCKSDTYLKSRNPRAVTAALLTSSFTSDTCNIRKAIRKIVVWVQPEILDNVISNRKI